MKKGFLVLSLILVAFVSYGAEKTAGYNIDRSAFFGDLHVHTKNSSDAFIFNVRATPDDAYLYSKGGIIQHSLGFPIQLHGGPLDFTAVTDHAELLGILPAMINPDSEMSKSSYAKDIQSLDRKKVISAFIALTKDSNINGNASEVRNLKVIRSAWQETIESAERHNQPGVFTTFVGYEYSSSPKNQNLHRNVIFKTSIVPDIPFSAIESDNPEDLWKWLDEIRNKGMDALAIPHNSNVSNGLMFQKTDWLGKPLDKDYAQLRMRNEPLVEITQVKGTSETHPLLSPNDEWADFELYDSLIASTQVAKKSGGFVREAYRHGLEFQNASAFNPYKFGLIGSSDTHNAGAPIEEDFYFSKAGTLDGSAELRGSIPSSLNKRFGGADASETFLQWGASGLTGIWAEENTRASLFNAMKRKETFATSGPRIRVRFFAGFEFSDSILSATDIISQAYKNGVPMGADLNADSNGKGNKSPSFIVWATQDIDSAKLQRLQVIKGWINNGTSHEQVFDVACSDGLTPNAKTHRCPNNEAKVNIDNCQPSADKGAIELKTLWRDPDFNSSQHAFYYVRVLENPTCRWSTWDAVKNNSQPVSGIKQTIQERAWSSPIWYIPKI